MWLRSSLACLIALAALGPLSGELGAATDTAASTADAVTAEAAAAPGPADPAGGVVGDGSFGSCNEDALRAALAGGGTVTFNCGGPTQFLIQHEMVISQPTRIFGGSLITITGGLTTRLFFVRDTGS